MTLALGNKNGPTITRNYTASDVAGEKWLADSGESNIVLNGDYDVYIVSCALSPATGTDTTKVDMYVGGELKKTQQNAPLKYDATINPFMISPFLVKRGMQLQVIQRA